MGVRIGPFDVGEAIGRGGMGEIRAATHVGLGQPVALKIVTGGADSEQAHATFRDEVRAVAALRHPHIVRVFDYGTLSAEAARGLGLQEDVPWLVMERAEGTLMEGGRLGTWEWVRSILVPLLDALAHAHARDVVHCDLKLSNVLVGGTRPGLKLADFGIAQALGDALRGEGLEQKSSGTPTYMAPEQFAGDVRDFGPWTDLYALGVLTWKLVTGSAPFRQTSWLKLMRAHLTAPVPPLRATDAFPPDLEEWLHWLLEKDPAARCRRAADAAHALSELKPPRGTSRAARPSRPDAATVPPMPAAAITLVWKASGTTPRTFDAASAKERPAPPMPDSWRRGEIPDSERALAGVGLGLFGLRPAPMVDREPARDALWAALQAVGGEVGMVALTGPAGMGKTRLARWLGRRAHELGAAVPLVVSHGPTPTEGDGLRAMWVRHLRCAGLDRRAVEERLVAVLGVSPPAAETFAGWLVPGGEGAARLGPTAQHRIGLELLRVVTRRRPALLVLDDLQWGPDTASFARFLLDETAGAGVRVLVVATVRTPADEAAVEALLGREDVGTMEVGPLAESDQEALVCGLLGVAPEVARSAVERSEGVPLFAVELVRDWVEREQLEPGPQGYRLRAAAAGLPADLLALWERRLRAVVGDPERWPSLELAAVLGREVNLAEWVAVGRAAGHPVDRLLLERLFVGGLARPIAGGWCFTHGMLHEALIRQADLRGQLGPHHLVCAGVVRDAERVGLHLFAAESWEEAASALLDGAAERDRRGEVRRTEWLLDRADEAYRRAGVAESDARRAWVRVRRARLVRYHGDLEASRAILLGAIDVARSEGAWWLSEALVDLTAVEVHAGRFAEGVSLAREAVAAAVHNPRPVAVGHAKVRLALALHDGGQIDEAVAVATEALAEAEAAGHRIVAGYCCTVLATGAQRAGDHGASVAWGDRALMHFEAVGDKVSVIDALMFRGSARFNGGDLQGAERDYRAGLELAQLLGIWNTVIFEVNLALIALGQDRFAEARRALESALRAVAGERVHLEAAVHGFLVLPVAAVGDLAALDGHLEAAERLLEQTGFSDLDLPRLLGRAVEVLRAAGDEGRAARVEALRAREQARLG